MKWSVTKHAHLGSWSVAMCFDSRWSSSYVAISTKMNPCLPGCSFGHQSYIQANTSWASREVLSRTLMAGEVPPGIDQSTSYLHGTTAKCLLAFDQCQQALRCCTVKIGWARFRSFNSFRQKHFLWLQFIWMCHWFSALWPKGETGNFSNCTFGSLKIYKMCSNLIQSFYIKHILKTWEFHSQKLYLKVKMFISIGQSTSLALMSLEIQNRRLSPGIIVVKPRFKAPNSQTNAPSSSLSLGFTHFHPGQAWRGRPPS